MVSRKGHPSCMCPPGTRPRVTPIQILATGFLVAGSVYSTPAYLYYCSATALLIVLLTTWTGARTVLYCVHPR